MKKIKGYNTSDLFLLAQYTNTISSVRVLATYANPKNWEKGYNGKDGSCQWIWKGPVICAFELAEWGLADAIHAEIKEDKK